MDSVLIYDRVVIDMHTMRVLESHAFMHEGEIALCKGKGGGSSTTHITNEVDKEYNARLAAVQERAQELSDEYFEFWLENQAPLEAAKAKAELENVPQQQKITQGLLGMQEASLGTTGELAQSYLKESLEGVNGQEWANRAAVDQQNAASSANATMARNASRLGLNLNSGAFQSAMADQATKNAAALGAAKTQAFRSAEQEKYNRLGQGLSAGLGLLSQS